MLRFLTLNSGAPRCSCAENPVWQGLFGKFFNIN